MAFKEEVSNYKLLVLSERQRWGVRHYGRRIAPIIPKKHRAPTEICSLDVFAKGSPIATSVGHRSKIFEVGAPHSHDSTGQQRGKEQVDRWKRWFDNLRRTRRREMMLTKSNQK